MHTQINNQIHETKHQLGKLDTNRKPWILEICSLLYLHIFHPFALIDFFQPVKLKNKAESKKRTVMKTMIMKIMLRVMTVIDDQMICIRSENRLDKTNKEIKGYSKNEYIPNKGVLNPNSFTVLQSLGHLT
jgi:uncharacterized membrane protein (DUF485 family)